MKVVVAIMQWGRPHVFRLWCEQFNVLRIAARDMGVDLVPVVCGSEGDESRSRIADIRGPRHYVEHPNAPLGSKANARWRAAVALDPDAIVFLGDDDFLSVASLRYTVDRLKGGADWVASLDYHFWWWEEGLLYSPGYSRHHMPHRIGEPLAPGRALSRKMVAALDSIDPRGPWPEDEPMTIDRPVFLRLWEACRSDPTIVTHFFRQIAVGAFTMGRKNGAGLGNWRAMSAHYQRRPSDLLVRYFAPHIAEGLVNVEPERPVPVFPEHLKK